MSFDPEPGTLNERLRGTSLGEAVDAATERKAAIMGTRPDAEDGPQTAMLDSEPTMRRWLMGTGIDVEDFEVLIGSMGGWVIQNALDFGHPVGTLLPTVLIDTFMTGYYAGRASRG